MGDGYLIRHIRELWMRSEYEVQSGAFLTPAEQRLIYDSIPEARHSLVFWGGAPDAERRCAFFIPDWLRDSVGENTASPFSEAHDAYSAALGEADAFGDAIRALRIVPGGFTALSHRDYLGAIMNLGIERETVGDISVGGDGATVFCLPTAASLIEAELKKIGREGVKIRGAADAEKKIGRRYETSTVVVSSMRIDCVVKALANLSREGAQQAIRSGLVEVNYLPCTDVSETLAEGDTLSVRGCGKFRVGETGGETRRERIRLKIQRYV